MDLSEHMVVLAAEDVLPELAVVPAAVVHFPFLLAVTHLYAIRADRWLVRLHATIYACRDGEARVGYPQVFIRNAPHPSYQRLEGCRCPFGTRMQSD